MRAVTVVQFLQDLFYVLLHVLFYLSSLLNRDRWRRGMLNPSRRSRRTVESSTGNALVTEAGTQWKAASSGISRARISSRRPNFPSPPFPSIFMWCHRARKWCDHSIRHMPFSIGGPLQPSPHLQPFLRYLSPTHIKPNTHRRRRRDETVGSRRVGVGGVYMNSQLAHDDCRRIWSTIWKLAKQTVSVSVSLDYVNFDRYW